MVVLLDLNPDIVEDFCSHWQDSHCQSHHKNLMHRDESLLEVVGKYHHLQRRLNFLPNQNLNLSEITKHPDAGQENILKNLFG
jgi:hypothetical protein